MATVTGTGSTNSYQFTGREHDGTGLLYYRARYYSPVIQRFISEDPIGFAGGDPNLYGYVINSPTNYTDPSGLFVYPGWPPPDGGSSSKSGDGSPPDNSSPPDPWDTMGFLPGGGAFGPGAKMGIQGLKGITGFTKHGINTTINRGIKPEAILDALKNPLKVTSVKVDNLGRPSFKMIGREAMVSINPSTKQIIQANPTSTNFANKFTQ